MAIKQTGKISATVESTFDLSGGVDLKARVTLGITFFDATGNVVTPSAGSYTITASPIGMANFLNIIDGDNIDATLPVPSLSYAANADALKYTPTGITGVTSIEITAKGNP